MKLMSDGLGKTVLSAEIVRVTKINDLIIFFANTTAPVKWKTKMGFQEEDVRALVLALFKPSNIFFVLKAFLTVFYRRCLARIGKTSEPDTIPKKEVT